MGQLHTVYEPNYEKPKLIKTKTNWKQKIFLSVIQTTVPKSKDVMPTVPKLRVQVTLDISIPTPSTLLPSFLSFVP